MKTETGLVKSDREQMRAALLTIDLKLNDFKAANDSTFKTNGEFRFNPAYTANSPIYIHKIKDVGLLLSILSYLTGQFNNYTLAAEKIVGLKTYPQFQWMGFCYEAWKHDLLIRLSHTTQHVEIEKLKAAKVKLEQFMTEEDRLASALQELKDLI